MYHSPAYSIKPWEPYLVKDLNPTLGSDADIEQLTRVGSRVFFTAFTAEAGKELWVTDGTSAGTYLVKDIIPGRFDPYIKELTEVNEFLFFTADDGINGRELWKSNGTAVGTVMVRDVNPGFFGSEPKELVNSDGILYSQAGTSETGRELLRSDGTPEGTYLIDVKDYCEFGICLGSHPRPLGVVNGIFYFTAIFQDTTGSELWRTDGTKGGTWLVKDINPGRPHSESGGDHAGDLEIAVLDGIIYFSATDGQNGQELWRSDGSEAGTYLVKDIRPEPISSYATGSRPRQFAVLGNNIYFFADDDIDKSGALWKTDGTEEGTVKITVGSGIVFRRVDHLANVNGRLWFQADDGFHGLEPWISDGTPQGTRLVKDLNETPTHWDPARTQASFPKNFRPFLGQTLIQTINSLWLSDGTTDGTVEVPSSEKINIKFGDASVAGAKVVFYAEDGVHGQELWAADFTLEGTSMVMDINPTAGSDGVIYNTLTAVGDEVFFLSTKSLYDYSDSSFTYFKSDGTAEGTVPIKGPKITTEDGTIINGIFQGSLEFNGKLVLQYELPGMGIHRSYLFLSDGSDAGIGEIYRGAGIQHLRSVSGKMYFSDYETEFVYPFGGPIVMNSWRRVMQSDGTPEGTIELARFLIETRGDNYNNNLLSNDCDSSLPREGYWSGPDFTRSNGKVYFNFCDVEHGFELWSTDGTPEGTGRVADINPSGIDIYGRERIFHGDPRDLTDVDGSLFFRAYTEDEGSELWKSDGTSEGTTLVQDIWPGEFFDYTCSCYRPKSSLPYFLTSMNGELFFSADNGDPLGGLHELWKSDGTEQGTVNIRTPLVSALWNILKPTVFDGNLYFRAWDYVPPGCYPEFPLYGYELWRTDGTDFGATIVKDIFTEFEYEFPGVSGAYCWGSGALPSIVADNQLLFSASLPESGPESWRTDGTEEGTILIADVNPGPFGGGTWSVYAGDKAYGVLDNGTIGRELWAMNAYWTLEVDIKPDSETNCVNINEHGVIPVAIMGSDEVKVRDINLESLSLQGLDLKMAGKSGKYLVSYEKVNGDEFEDMIAHFEDSDSWVTPGTEMAKVTGRLMDGTMVKGRDQICIVP